MTGKDVRPWEVTDMVIMGISIVDPDLPIMMTPGITVSGVIGVILRMTRHIVTLPRGGGARLCHD